MEYPSLNFYKAISVYANRLLLWVQICDAKFLKYKISICLDHTYMYIVLWVPYTCNFIAIDIIMWSINCRGNQILKQGC